MQKKERPIISIPKTDMDKLIEILGWLAFIALIILPIYFYNQLPESIPIHFDGSGKPDSYGGKKMFLLIPIIGIILFILLKKLSQHPSKFNYPVKITEDNAILHYTIASRMIRTINALTTVLMAYITYGLAMVALDKQESLGYPIFILIGLILFVTVYSVMKHFQVR